MKEITFDQLKQLVMEAYDYEDVIKGKRTPEKFYIVAERDNPQLGTYLSDVFVGKRRDKDGYILCSYDYYGSRKSLKFAFGMNDGKHWCINPGSSVYGSMDYYGFDTAEEAKEYLEANWSDHHNFKKCMDKLGQPIPEAVQKKDFLDGIDPLYAILIKDIKTGLYHLYVGEESEMAKLNKVLKQIDDIVVSKNGTDEELQSLYDKINTFDYYTTGEDGIDPNDIDGNNEYYDFNTDRTYIVINNAYYEMI